jgi:hypothetical protein
MTSKSQEMVLNEKRHIFPDTREYETRFLSHKSRQKQIILEALKLSTVPFQRNR